VSMRTRRFLMDTTGCAYTQNRSEAARRGGESCGAALRPGVEVGIVQSGVADAKARRPRRVCLFSRTRLG
jgi:hypothetical protein